MGDGDHGWAAAEFLNLIRDVLVREESGQLLLLSGAPENWFYSGSAMQVTSAPSLHGTISYRVEIGERSIAFNWSLSRKAHQEQGDIVLCLPLPFARTLGIPGKPHGPHLRITLSEDSGRRLYEKKETPWLVTT